MTTRNWQNFYEEVSGMISDAFDNSFGRKITQPKLKKVMIPQTQPIVEVKATAKTSPNYQSIEDYTEKTGKRFRMTKDQKNRNLTREEAFAETYGGGGGGL